MNQLKVFAVYDAAVGAYLHPMFFQSRGQAIRAWLDACEDEKSMFAKHPADYTLFEIGEYDETSGEITANTAKINLGTALALISTSKNAPLGSNVSPEQGELLPISKTTDRIRESVERHSERNMQ